LTSYSSMRRSLIFWYSSRTMYSFPSVPTTVHNRFATFEFKGQFLGTLKQQLTELCRLLTLGKAIPRLCLVEDIRQVCRRRTEQEYCSRLHEGSIHPADTKAAIMRSKIVAGTELPFCFVGLMKTTLTLLGMFLLAMPTAFAERSSNPKQDKKSPQTCATCTGAASCNACKNCKYCGHCSKGGGSCGVCKSGARK
jgi:hypothetical protein